MSGGPKRNEDKLNTIGVVVVGICGAVMVYVTIVALQAFYMNDTSELQTMADYGGQDTTAKRHKADEMQNITQASKNGIVEGMPQTFHTDVQHAMELVVRDAANDATHLIPSAKPSDKATVKPIFGHGQPLVTPPAAPATGSGAAPATGSGAAPATGSGAPAPATGSGAGSANPAPVRATPGGAPDKGALPTGGGPAPAPPKTPAPGGHAP